MDPVPDNCFALDAIPVWACLLLPLQKSFLTAWYSGTKSPSFWGSGPDKTKVASFTLLIG